MPSIINQNENMYNGIVIAICIRTITQGGSLFQNDFCSSAEENNGRATVVVGVWRLLGGGVNNASSVSMEEKGVYKQFPTYFGGVPHRRDCSLCEGSCYALVGEWGC